MTTNPAASDLLGSWVASLKSNLIERATGTPAPGTRKRQELDQQRTYQDALYKYGLEQLGKKDLTPQQQMELALSTQKKVQELAQQGRLGDIDVLVKQGNSLLPIQNRKLEIQDASTGRQLALGDRSYENREGVRLKGDLAVLGKEQEGRIGVLNAAGDLQKTLYGLQSGANEKMMDGFLGFAREQNQFKNDLLSRMVAMDERDSQMNNNPLLQLIRHVAGPALALTLS